MANIRPMCAITTPAHPQIKEVKLKTYKLKTVDHTNDKTIKICNLTVFGKLLISFFESSNIIFADSIKKFLILSIINLFYPFLLFYKHNSKFSHFKTKFCHSSSINSNSFVLFKYPVIKSNLNLFAFNRN